MNSKPTPENEISEVTRRSIIDHFTISDSDWAGRLSEDDFLARLYDLTKLPSTDYRYSTAAGDIFQHRVRNQDWNADWVFYDSRFNLLRASTAEFLKFLCETVHPVVRPSADQASTLVRTYNEFLATDGWQLTEGSNVSGRSIYVARSTSRITVFQEPVGWQKVDRQLQEIRSRLEGAQTEEQYQAIGLLCREALISVAQEVYEPPRHPSVDGTTPSATDARRMLEAIFDVELKGSSNEEARGHAKASVKLALALQHKRTADFKTAALCAEGTYSVVNMLAIVTGRRGVKHG